MYKKTERNPPKIDSISKSSRKFTFYNKILNTSINEAKSSYCHRCFINTKNDMEIQWSTINEILHKQTDHFVIDGKQLTDQKAYSNAFNNYFVNIGPALAGSIKLLN